MSKISDFVYALKIVNLLKTPWTEMDAYKLGIIDEKGNVLKKYKDLKTPEEKAAYTYLHRLVFNIKRILSKATGGSKFLDSVSSSLLLLKESLQDVEMSEDAWHLIEESIYNYNEDTPSNVSGNIADAPKPLMKKRRKKDLTE